MAYDLTSEDLVDLTEAADELDAEVDVGYSGRGMFGATCLAFRFNGSPAAFAMRLARELSCSTLGPVLAGEDVAEDQMGLGHVVYWPHVNAHHLGDEEG
jgi:hypothetical protein